MRLQIIRLGAGALRFLEASPNGHLPDRHPPFRLAAMFDRSLHLERAGSYCCVGDPSIGNGPLNAIVVSMPAGRHDTQDVQIDFRTAERWVPGPLPPMPSQPAVWVALSHVAAIVARDAPREGLARLAVCRDAGSGINSALGRVAGPRLAKLEQWLLQRFAAAALGSGSPHPAPFDLLGLGPGLTPSGDDLLCGLMIGLHAIGDRNTAVEFGREIAKQAPRATSPLSAAFLAEAAGGAGSEALHLVIAAILGGARETLDYAIADVASIGHTSGWDALAGATLALGLHAGRQTSQSASLTRQ